MNDSTDNLGIHHNRIRTKHVYIEGNQVFMKRENQLATAQESHEEIWYPINFQWIPFVALKQDLMQQSKDFR